MDVIFSHMLTTYNKKRPIAGRSVNKRMVGQKLEMSSRSGSNYLTLAEKSRFWYQIAPGGFETRLYVHSSLQSS